MKRSRAGAFQGAKAQKTGAEKLRAQRLFLIWAAAMYEMGSNICQKWCVKEKFFPKFK